MELLRRNPATVPFLTVAAAELVAPPEHGVAPRRGASIDYTAGEDRRAPGTRLFWGPYVALAAGVYLLRFNGRLDGTLAVEFAHDRGNRVIAAETLAGFERYCCLVLTRPVADLEIRGTKTAELRGFSLESIAVHRLFCPPAG